MATGDFEAAYDELSSLRESYYIDTDEKAVQAVAEAVMADEELTRWWKFAEERCLNSRGRFKTALEEQIYTSLHTFPCHSAMGGAKDVTLDYLRGRDSLSEEVRDAARYVVNRAAFMACGLLWAEELDKKDLNIAGFKIALDYRSIISDGGRSMHISFISDDWDFRGQLPDDFRILIELEAPDFKILSQLPCDELLTMYFKVDWMLYINGIRYGSTSAAIRGWRFNPAVEKYDGITTHAPINGSWRTLRRKLTTAIEDMTADLKQHQQPTYWIELNPDILGNSNLKGEGSEQDILDSLKRHIGKTKVFSLRQDKRLKIAPKAIEKLVLKPLIDMVKNHQWTTTQYGDKMIKFDVDMQALRKYTKDHNLPLDD